MPSLPAALMDMRSAYANRVVGEKRRGTVEALRKWLMEYPKDFMAELRRMEADQTERDRLRALRRAAAEKEPAAGEVEVLLGEEPVEELIRELIERVKQPCRPTAI